MLPDSIRYPTVRMNPSYRNESSTFEDLIPVARDGILSWMVTHVTIPTGDGPLTQGSDVLGVAFHRGVAVMEKVSHLLHQLGTGRCGPAHFPNNHPSCAEPSRSMYPLYVATRNLYPYLQGLYRLDAFLEELQRAIWNELHGTVPPFELLIRADVFAKTPIECENGPWLQTTLQWLAWIQAFAV